MPLVFPEAQHIYLSPHLDDAALSCGGMIALHLKRGESVAVITVFAASPPSMNALSPFARELHERWQRSAPDGIDFTDPPAARCEEDRRALAALGTGIQIVHYTLADCVYRCSIEVGEALYASREAIFGPPQPTDPALPDLVVVPHLSQDSFVYAPLAIGGHVDHHIMRHAVERWGLPASRLWFYEDYPYAASADAEADLAALQSGWASRTVALTNEALATKIAAISRYKSQISSFWKDDKEMSAAITQFARLHGGEQLWRPA